jgi:hypothetical protein
LLIALILFSGIATVFGFASVIFASVLITNTAASSMTILSERRMVKKGRDLALSGVRSWPLLPSSWTR